MPATRDAREIGARSHRDRAEIAPRSRQETGRAHLFRFSMLGRPEDARDALGASSSVGVGELGGELGGDESAPSRFDDASAPRPSKLLRLNLDVARASSTSISSADVAELDAARDSSLDDARPKLRMRRAENELPLPALDPDAL